MNKIPTAEEFMNSEQFEPDKGISFEDYHGDNASLVPTMMIEFAKLHIKKALSEAYNNASLKELELGDKDTYICHTCNDMGDIFVLDKESILNSYPEELII